MEKLFLFCLHLKTADRQFEPERPAALQIPLKDRRYLMRCIGNEQGTLAYKHDF